MIDCTNEENIDNFLQDLKNLIEMTHAFSGLANKVGEIEGLPKRKRKIMSDGFDWFDDGKNNLTIEIKPIDTAKPSKTSTGNE